MSKSSLCENTSIIRARLLESTIYARENSSVSLEEIGTKNL